MVIGSCTSLCGRGDWWQAHAHSYTATGWVGGGSSDISVLCAFGAGYGAVGLLSALSGGGLEMCLPRAGVFLLCPLSCVLIVLHLSLCYIDFLFSYLFLILSVPPSSLILSLCTIISLCTCIFLISYLWSPISSTYLRLTPHFYSRCHSTPFSYL